MDILLAESQPQVRFALRVMLERREGMRVVSEVVNMDDLLAQIHETPANLVLLGWGSPGLADRQLPALLRQARPDIPLIVLSERQELRQAALDAGARAFVSKGNPPAELLSAIDDCLAHRASDRDSP